MVTSVVLNDDVVPRMSAQSIEVLADQVRCGTVRCGVVATTRGAFGDKRPSRGCVMLFPEKGVANLDISTRYKLTTKDRRLQKCMINPGVLAVHCA